MSRPGITYQEVSNAAIQLQGQNENLTVDRAREILETGSKCTIARYLKEWKSKSGQETGFDVPRELISIVKGLWERLKTEADQKILNSQQETERDIKEIHQILTLEQKRSTDLMANVGDLEEQLHQKKKCDQLAESCLKYQKRREEKSDAIIDLEKKLATSSTQTASLQRLLSKAEDKILILRDQELLLVQEKCHLEGQFKQLETRM